MEPASTAINLRRLVTLRTIAIVAQATTVLIVYFGLHVRIPLWPMLSVIGALALANVLTVAALRRSASVRHSTLFGQLLIDIGALTGLLYLAGGASNPFTMLYLLPLAIGAAALTAPYVWLMAAIEIACYTGLLFWHVPLPHDSGMHHGASPMHVAGMWLGFVVSAGLIALFSVRISSTVRERDRALAAMRESELRNQTVIALGAQAAGAAHELGTPLSTMAVLAGELEADVHGSTEAMDRLTLLRGQIQRCKATLSRLSGSVGDARAESAQALELDVFLEQVIRRWRSTRPSVDLVVNLHGARPGPRIAAEQTLAQTVMNVLNNAADASDQPVEIDAGWSEGRVDIVVCDRGPGFQAMDRARAGKAPFTNKPQGEGMGLGLFLSHTTIERLGGEVRVYNREGGGACTKLWIPLGSLRVEDAA